MAKASKGTKYTPKDTEQRSYFLPPGLGDLFRQFCSSNHGGASAGARGALVLFMAMDDYPALRERAIRAADQLQPKAAVADLKAKLLDVFGEALMRRHIQSLSQREKDALLKQSLDKKRRT